MPDSDDKLTRSIAVPAWMVYLFSTGGLIMAATISGVVIQDRGQVHALSNEMAELKSRQTAMEVKQTDFIAMFNSINSSINSLERKMDVVDARLGKLMP